MMIDTFETIASDSLVTATGGQGQGQPPAQQPRNNNGLSTGDVLEVAGRATQTVLSRGKNIPGNLGQAYRQFNDPRVGNGFWDKAAYGFTGLFGIDPLAGR